MSDPVKDPLVAKEIEHPTSIDDWIHWDLLDDDWRWTHTATKDYGGGRNLLRDVDAKREYLGPIPENVEYNATLSLLYKYLLNYLGPLGTQYRNKPGVLADITRGPIRDLKGMRATYMGGSYGMRDFQHPHRCVEFLESKCRHSGLRAQIEEAPHILAEQYEILKHFSEKAESELAQYGKFPSRRDALILDYDNRVRFPKQDDYHKFFKFLDEFYCAHDMTTEPMARFMTASGSMEGYKTTGGFGFVHWAMLAHAIFTNSIARDYSKDTIPVPQRLDRLTRKPLHYDIALRTLGNNVIASEFEKNNKEEFEYWKTLGSREFTCYMLRIGLAAKRWGFDQCNSQEEANAVADKMSRLYDFELCAKTVKIYKKKLFGGRLGQSIEDQRYLLGWTQDDLDYLKAYGDRLQRREAKGETILECERQLVQNIEMFFKTPSPVEGQSMETYLKRHLRNDPTLSAAGFHVNEEHGFCKAFQEEIRKTHGDLDAPNGPYQQLVRRQAAKQSESEASVG